ncbi:MULTISPECIES: acyl carrier protein [Pseudomonas fluorescens group]|uniref:Acyl carrier protein n=1 Tax=Pseudomonas fluorescens TaxID=294 RepID=A0AAE2U547_PSEFL|nr:MULTISPECIES: acyl carrier protein [Pseudomonas fluorescens group]MBA1429397.1 acyl carrier protein [Pseudomonas orientalis]MBD8273022.1 acyl carrier protein [Pseudomonas fluorescens]
MTQADVFDLIVKHTRETLPELAQPIGQDDRLVDLGANSMDRADIVAMTLSALGLRMPMVQTQQARNIGELAKLLHGKL